MGFAALAAEHQSVTLLQRSLERGRLGHAYLFTGERLEALEQLANALAKTLCCERRTVNPDGSVAARPDSCDACSTCRRIEAANYPDVQWIRPEMKSRVIIIDQIREVTQVMSLKPAEAPYKLAVIVAADRMNSAAANAFLKTLEEPPPRSVLLLLSTEPQRLLDTILSRCLRVNLGGAGECHADAATAAWLGEFASLAAAPTKGLLGRYRLLDRVLARLEQVKQAIDAKLTSASPLEKYDDVDPRLREKWEEELAAAIEAEYRRQRGDLIAALQWWFRDVWLLSLTHPEARLSFAALGEQAAAVAGRLATEDALANLQVLEETQRLLHTNVQEALVLEVGWLKLKL